MHQVKTGEWEASTLNYTYQEILKTIKAAKIKSHYRLKTQHCIIDFRKVSSCGQARILNNLSINSSCSTYNSVYREH